MKSQAFNLKNIYKLPWTTFNNPNGWIEPTTYCQLACPGCYRGLSLPNHQKIHYSLAKLKKEINHLIKIRKIKILAIAGGEPLLYPKLEQLIRYARSKGLKVRIVTNGAALTVDRLNKLKKAGVTEVAIHVASYQNRLLDSDENKLNLLRLKYCQMFRQVDNVILNFIITVSRKNITQLPVILNFYQENSDIVNRVLFTLYRDFFFEKNHKENTKNYVSIKRLAEIIAKTYKVHPCAYLGRTQNTNNPSWLFYAPILLGNKTIGYANGETVKKLHQNTSTDQWDAFPARESTRSLLETITYLSLTNARDIFMGYLTQIINNPKYLFKLPKIQILILINTPRYTKQGWDFCDGCPDPVLYHRKLVPSCLLERVKNGENIMLN